MFGEDRKEACNIYLNVLSVSLKLCEQAEKTVVVKVSFSCRVGAFL